MSAQEMIELAERLAEGYHYSPLEDAALILKWAAELDPDESIRRRRAEILTKLGRADEARAILEELSPPRDADELNAAALSRAGAYDLDGALPLLDRALELDPTESLLYANRGLVHFHKGDYEAAALDLARSATVPMFPAFSFRHSSQPGKGDFGVLLNGFARIRAEADGHDLAFGLINVWAHLVKEELDEADRLLARLEKRDAATWAIPALRAATEDEREHDDDDREKAQRRVESLVRVALSRAPDEVALLARLAQHLMWENPGRMPLLERIAELRPRCLQAHVDAGTARLHAKDHDAALAHVERALALDGESERALSLRASIREDRREFELALPDREALVTILGADDESPIDPEDWDARSWRSDHASTICDRASVRYELRDLDGARADYDLAVRMVQGDATWLPRLLRATFRARTGDRAGAIEDLAAAEKIQPGLPRPYQTLLARLKEKTGDLEGAKRIRADLLAHDRKTRAAEKRRERAEERKKAKKRASRAKASPRRKRRRG